jgi:hypothetical protein
VLDFTAKLIPGDTYTLCEVVPVGWMTDLSGDSNPYTPSPPNDREDDNSLVCVDFSVEAGQTRTFDVDNTPPPGGAGRTIGYWKNWNDCTNGGQSDSLTAAIDATPSDSITIGKLVISLSDPKYCQKARNILDKRTLAGKKAASDPGFNLAAQLLAAQLNVAAGAGTCPAANMAIQDAQSLLYSSGWDGTTLKKIPKNKVALANSLATKLDMYNNNELC